MDLNSKFHRRKYGLVIKIIETSDICEYNWENISTNQKVPNPSLNSQKFL